MTKFSNYSAIRGFALILFIWFSQSIYAQRIISGVVMDGDFNEPLIGASIVAKGNNSVGTVTDFDGNFSLTLPNDITTLVISYVGYTSIELNVSGNGPFTATLYAGKALEEVVVIGYGTVRREDVTGAIQSVGSESFNRGAITSAQELLAGKVAGVAITTGGGPDDGAQIRIRGESSLGALNDPLIVVDGVPLDFGGVAGNRNPLNIINPNDIERMDVLKDASATAIYGSRAAGGVIMITTKKGTIGSKMKVNYNGNVSVGQPMNYVDVLSADEYRQLINDIRPDNVGLLGDANTDWQREIYRDAWAHDHNVSASGAVGVIPYRVSLGFTSKDGLLQNDNFTRYTAAVNVNPRLLKNTLQLNLGLKTMLVNNQFAERGAIGSALTFDPTQAIFDPESQYLGGYTVWTQANGNPKLLAPNNPLSLLDLNLRNDNSSVSRYIVNASADYRLPFLPDLRANLSLAHDYSSGSGSLSIPGGNTVPFSFDQVNGGGVNNTYSQTRVNSVLEFYLNYKKNFGEHDIDAIGGYSWQYFYDENSFRNTDAAGTPANTIQRDNIASELYLLSLFGRVNYGFKGGKFLLTATLRGDATSRFAPENRWGLFPALAGAVKLIDNKDKYFNNVKVRAGWGITGQQEIGGRYLYQARYVTALPNAFYQFGDQFIETIRPEGYDRNIKWEETTTVNLAVDFSIIRDRLSGSIDVYQRNTNDLLNFIAVPAGTNLTNFINTNVGDMVNKGVELALNIQAVRSSKLNWNIGFNGAYNYNEVTRLLATDDPEYLGIFTGGIAGGVGNTIQIHSVGFAPRSFFVFDQLYDENGRLLPGQFRDQNGDGIINDDDKIRYNQPAPFYTFGITSNMNFGNFDFSFAGRANLGNWVYNNVATDMGYLQRLVHPDLFLSNIHRSGVVNNIEAQANATFSNHFVTNASFLRFDHFTVGYTFDKVVGDFLRVYATIQNPFFITRYDGLDPEIGNGIDNNIYPRPRTYLLGVSVQF